jgi:hypothetical protein
MFSKAFLLDLLERVVRTGIQAALAVLALNLTDVTDLDTAKAVGIAAASAALAAVIGVLTKSIGDPQTASILPPPAPPA